MKALKSEITRMVRKSFFLNPHPTSVFLTLRSNLCICDASKNYLRCCVVVTVVLGLS